MSETIRRGGGPGIPYKKEIQPVVEAPVVQPVVEEPKIEEKLDILAELIKETEELGLYDEAPSVDVQEIEIKSKKKKKHFKEED